MPRIVFSGPWRFRIGSFIRLMQLGFWVKLRHARGQKLHSDWDADHEIGTLFWRGQFERALRLGDMGQGRRLFDSLQTYAGPAAQVRRQPVTIGGLAAEWITPNELRDDVTVLYLHGGGYAFHAAVTRDFAAMLADLLGRRVLVPDYRLTPEHPHPAQLEDALTAWVFLLDQGAAPDRMVILGDSAGGHLMLMTLLALRDRGLAQPATGIGLSPWTDIGARGRSLTGNDRYDLVQGWMTLLFGEWLQAGSGLTREALSPVDQDYSGCAPIYLQAAECEVLVDQARDMARRLQAQSHPVMLEIWPGVVHEFHAYGRHLPQSAQAFDRLNAAIAARMAGQALPKGPQTRWIFPQL